MIARLLVYYTSKILLLCYHIACGQQTSWIIEISQITTGLKSGWNERGRCRQHRSNKPTHYEGDQQGLLKACITPQLVTLIPRALHLDCTFFILYWRARKDTLFSTIEYSLLLFLVARASKRLIIGFVYPERGKALHVIRNRFFLFLLSFPSPEIGASIFDSWIRPTMGVFISDSGPFEIVLV